MRVVVMGAGLLGVATTHYLLNDGHEVTVVERRGNAGAETSFANAGLICAGHSYPWASPAALRILVKSLIRNDQALRLKVRPDLRLWSWLTRFLVQCTPRHVRRNAASRLRLAHYSRLKLHELQAATPLRFSYARKGLVYLYRTAETLSEGAKSMGLLAELGLNLRMLDREETVALEPALALSRTALAGAAYCPDDESGDAHEFCEQLARLCVQRGARFRYHTDIQQIVTHNDFVSEIVTTQGNITGDAFVLALGSYSPCLARPIGVRLQVTPVKGYSMTVPIREGHVAPEVGGIDEDNLLAFSRLGNRLRLTATAEFAGYDVSHQPRDFRFMSNAAQSLLPQAADYERPQYWAGLRPLTPDGNPVLGRARYRNLYVNTGHGSLGWTTCCGSGQIIADVMAGRSPDIELKGLLYEADQ